MERIAKEIDDQSHASDNSSLNGRGNLISPCINYNNLLKHVKQIIKKEGSFDPSFLSVNEILLALNNVYLS
jgi:hypothetical protein